MTAGKGIEAAEIARGFFGVQLHYADVLSAKAGIPLAEAIAFHTNFHRLFAYGNLSKRPPDNTFVSLTSEAVAIADPDKRVDLFIAAFADRPFDLWPEDRFLFGPHFACEAPNEAGAVRIHFRNRYNKDAIGPLDISNVARRRAELTEMFAFIAMRWPETKTVNGGSWLYNTEGYRRLFPAEFAASRTPFVGPRSTHGLSTWGQFVDFRGAVKPAVVEAFLRNLESLDPAQPWLVFPYQVLTTTAPFETFRREYGV